MTVKRREFSVLLGAAAAPLVQRANAQQNVQQKNAAPANPVPRLDWVARRKEPILEPGLKIIDPHHHLWQRPDWRYLLDDLLADTGSGHNIVATVYMEANSMYRDRGPEEMRPVGEVEFANGMAAMCSSGAFGKTRVAAGIVGHANMTLGSRVEPVINALTRAGGDRFRGIRHGVSWEAEAATIRPNPSTHPGMLADKKFREGIAVLGRLGLSYDVSLYHTQIPEVADLAGALPNTRIVLNHVGGVLGLGSYRSKQKEVFSLWASSIKALAARHNVYVKLGGLGQSYTAMRFDGDAEPPSSEQVAARFRPYVETCIGAFGASRCMFESNFPVDKISYSYHVFWNACKLMAKGASATEKADLFAGSAARCYRLEEIV
ncbi:MAG TPA: amidohydrolase family protein [Nitrospira sp.]|nr:amidohydrolase family protein [Nitrospira sp.]